MINSLGESFNEKLLKQIRASEKKTVRHTLPSGITYLTLTKNYLEQWSD